ncbi:MAG: hypothetical protein HOY69_34730, partial [Streptomyces sp.]|nr:hypothetical protein [Streptomyces sp.]
MTAMSLAAVPFASGGPAAPRMPDPPAAHGVRQAHYAAAAKPHDDAAANADTRQWRLPSGGSGTADLRTARGAGQAP